MQIAPKPILIDCERMKSPYTGLYSFCDHLTKALLDQKSIFDFSFYVPENVIQHFSGYKTVKQKAFNKFYFPLRDNYLLWHSTYQLSPYQPFNKKLPVVLTIHDLNFLYDDQKNQAKQNRYAKQIQKNINRASHIVCISESTLKDVQMHLNISDKPVSVIYNGCSITEIEHLTVPVLLPEGEFLFTIGTIMSKKNFHVLPCLLHNNQYKLVIAGIVHSDAYKQKIIAEAQKFGVADQVIFTGAITENDKQWYYKNCAAFLFPSVSEGFGLPVVEAMHFGKPVLLSKFTSLPEIGGSETYYFNDFEPENMQNALTNALNDFYNNARATAIIQRASLFTWETAAKKYIDVYKSVAGI